MSDSGQTGGAGRGRGASASSASATSSAASQKLEPVDRPGASGHRFGPDLTCSECGIQWDVHQREPRPCETDRESSPQAGAFLRRPTAVKPEDKSAAADRTDQGTASTSTSTPEIKKS